MVFFLGLEVGHAITGLGEEDRGQAPRGLEPVVL